MTFGSSSSLQRIGVSCFMGTQVGAVNIPNSVRELCDRCFCGCRSLSHVAFGSSSSLERIGVSCFEHTGVEAVSIPDSVRKLCDGCFKSCKNLRRVTFGSSPSLERIGDLCFAGSGLVTLETPPCVKHVGERLFGPIVSILVRSPGRLQFRMDVPLTYRIEEIKAKIWEHEGIPPDSQQLSFGYNELEEGKTLMDYGVTEDSKMIIIDGRWEHGVSLTAAVDKC